jgi:3'(2'), 5'-bisphosphate nucleotidase
VPEAVDYSADPRALFPDERSDDLCLAIEAAVLGGAATWPYYRTASLRTEEKQPGDPVTEADHAANRTVLALLDRRRPSDPVLSEESPLPPARRLGGRLWVVDPLDGTREFIDGIDEFAVMVGLAENGAATLGAVYVPGGGTVYAGVAEGGAWTARCDPGGDSSTMVVKEFSPLAVGSASDGAIRLVRSRSHPDAVLQAIEEELPGAVPIPSGSVGVKCARIAERQADLYVHPVPYLKEWDTCAPEAILRGAGGRVTDCAGGELAYGKEDPRQPRGILAGDPGSWEAALPLVRRLAASIL